MKFLMLLGLMAPVVYGVTNTGVITQVCERMKYKDCALVKAIIQVESSGNPLAIGHDGAGSLGLMQIKCSTAWTLDRYYKRSLVKCKDLFNPQVNIAYGIQYLQYIEELITSPISIPGLLSVYNGGYEFHKPTGHYRVKKCNTISLRKKRKCKEGIEPFNVEYSRKVIRIYNQITKE